MFSGGMTFNLKKCNFFKILFYDDKKCNLRDRKDILYCEDLWGFFGLGGHTINFIREKWQEMLLSWQENTFCSVKIVGRFSE